MYLFFIQITFSNFQKDKTNEKNTNPNSIYQQATKPNKGTKQAIKRGQSKKPISRTQ
jgi:hypothetical protein